LYNQSFRPSELVELREEYLKIGVCGEIETERERERERGKERERERDFCASWNVS
jgi:hypothetical protein